MNKNRLSLPSPSLLSLSHLFVTLYVGPGGVFGVVSLFDTESSSVADVVSESVGEVAVFRHEDIERMKSSNPQLAVKL